VTTGCLVNRGQAWEATRWWAANYADLTLEAALKKSFGRITPSFSEANLPFAGALFSKSGGLFALALQ